MNNEYKVMEHGELAKTFLDSKKTVTSCSAVLWNFEVNFKKLP